MRLPCCLQHLNSWAGLGRKSNPQSDNSVYMADYLVRPPRLPLRPLRRPVQQDLQSQTSLEDLSFSSPRQLAKGVSCRQPPETFSRLSGAAHGRPNVTVVCIIPTITHPLPLFLHLPFRAVRLQATAQQCSSFVLMCRTIFIYTIPSYSSLIVVHARVWKRLRLPFVPPSSFGPSTFVQSA